ncbi:MULTISPECIES: hypothetical protein [unclassified Acinetobacter]|uniref:hypothetical protein n=1 Tax=unclassified Acinetobacter TaxID=196816 RepID=UPI0015D3EB17|nr:MULTISPECIES: hypothetical protein [unclassified Acinetobacter]
MSIKLLSSLFVLVAFTAVGCNNDSDSTAVESKAKYDVDYYVANPKVAYKVVDDCNAQASTIVEHEDIFSKGDCKNAMLAKKKIIQLRNNPNNEKPSFDFSNVNTKEKV